MSGSIRRCAAVGLIAAGAGGALAAGTAAAAELPRSTPPELAATFKLFRGPAVKEVPRWVTRLAQSGFGEPHLLNPKLARTFVSPGGRMTWYAVPGSRGLCLFAKGGGACTSTERALEGGLYLQSIEPYVGPDALTSPLPADHGQPQRSTTIGLAPDGVTAVRAATKSGTTIDGRLGPDGAYRLTGIDVTKLLLERSTLEVPLVLGSRSARP